MNKPFIILMSGMPASGKSTAAKEFTEWYNQNFNMIQQNISQKKMKSLILLFK